MRSLAESELGSISESLVKVAAPGTAKRSSATDAERPSTSMRRAVVMEAMINDAADNLEICEARLWNCGENIFCVVALRAQK